MKNILRKVTRNISEVLDFQARVWVVNVYAGEHKGESYVVNEDSFSEAIAMDEKERLSHIHVAPG